MNITEHAALVLQQIDAALALAEKATPGPWWDGIDVEHGTYPDVFHFDAKKREHVTKPKYVRDATFIATSRTLLPASLEIIRDDIKSLLQITDTNCHGDGLGCLNVAVAERRLIALCDQWEVK